MMVFLCIYFVMQKPFEMSLTSGKIDGSAHGSVPWQRVLQVLMSIVWHWIGRKKYLWSLSYSQTTGA